MVSRAKTPEAKTLCKKVYEALRYSDPVSSEALAVIEGKIEAQFSVFSNDVSSNATQVLLLMISERNKTCKLLK